MATALFAKSASKNSPVAPTLLGHTLDVHQAAAQIFGLPGAASGFAEPWLRFFRIADPEQFLAALEAAALFHDIGKANDRFQAAVGNRGRGNVCTEQLIRHEHLSGLILCLPEFQQWTAARSDIDWDVVLGAVLSHHCKAADPRWPDIRHGFARPIAGRPHGMVELHSHENEFHQLLGEISRQLGLLSEVPELPRFWSFRDRQHPGSINLKSDSAFIGDVTDRLEDFDDEIGETGDQNRRRLMHAVRAALIVADSVGSGIVRVGDDIRAWTAHHLSSPHCTSREVNRKIIQPRIEQLTAAGKWDSTRSHDGWSDFQIRCDSLPSRSLLIAPCGSGKTLAAWRWIAAQCDRAIKRGQPVRRAIFLYPTRATASEGFRDYVSWAPEDEAGLLTGTASFDLDGMFGNPDNDTDDRHARNYETDGRLFALGHWNKRFFSATVDQFLGFMQYAYGSMVLLPMLAESVVVVDEVHSFDRGLFSALKDFLKNFNVPVLCMTASLSEYRKSQLEQYGLELCDDKSGDLQTIADAPRYGLAWTDSTKVIDEVRRHLASGRRVLWVVNQVARAQQAVCDIVFNSTGDHSPADLLGQFGDVATVTASIGDEMIPVHCFHSRFRLRDRRERHKGVVSSFQAERAGTGPLLAITTQVCEMSLDLDADVVISELAPATALIQRMGRCNRVRKPRELPSGSVLISRPENELPYEQSQLDQAASFVDRLIETGESSGKGEGRISQSRLEATLAEFDEAPEIHRSSQFLNSGPFAAMSDSLRDGDEFTTPAILPQDVGQVLAAMKQRHPIDKWITPVSRRWKQQDGAIDPRLPRHVIVAPNGHYHLAVGFCESPITTNVDLQEQSDED